MVPIVGAILKDTALREQHGVETTWKMHMMDPLKPPCKLEDSGSTEARLRDMKLRYKEVKWFVLNKAADESQRG